MLELKKINIYDAKDEWKYITNMPQNENGLTNPYYGIKWEDFISNALPLLIGYSDGVNLPDGYVPETYFFLFNNGIIIGEFRIRHYLNESLKNGAGHIGYGIIKDFRNMGFATKGLSMAIEEAKKIIPETEIYMRLQKANIASLKVMEKNGAYIVNEDEQYIFTRIKIK